VLRHLPQMTETGGPFVLSSLPLPLLRTALSSFVRVPMAPAPASPAVRCNTASLRKPPRFCHSHRVQVDRLLQVQQAMHAQFVAGAILSLLAKEIS
jgi:hypothetical protein